MRCEMTTRINKINSLSEAIQTFVADFLTQQANEKGKIRLEDALEALKGDETQAILADIVKDTFPKRKVSQKLKDPEAPKKPLNAYMIFCKSRREKAKAMNPPVKIATKELAETWKTLSDKKKLKYKKKEDTLKIEYKKVMASYERPSDEELVTLKVNQPKVSSAGEKTRKPRAKKDPNAPKGPRSAYVFFCQDMRNEIAYELEPEASHKDVMKHLVLHWNSIKEDEQASRRWHKMAKKDKKRYEAEMVLYSDLE